MVEYDEMMDRHGEDRRIRKTIQSLHEAFLTLAQRQKVEKITVAALTKEADVNRKTFYLHYGSIDDLVDEVLHDEIVRRSKVLEKAILDSNGQVDVQQLFVALGTELLESMVERQSILKNVNGEWLLNRIEPIFVQELVEQDTFGLAEALGDRLEFCVTFLCAGLIGTYRTWINGDSEMPMERLTELLGAMVAASIQGALVVTR